MATDFDYNDIDVPQLVQPTPAPDEVAGGDFDRNQPPRVRRRQSSRSRSLDDPMDNFHNEGNTGQMSASSSRNNSRSYYNNNRDDSFDDYNNGTNGYNSRGGYNNPDGYNAADDYDTPSGNNPRRGNNPAAANNSTGTNNPRTGNSARSGNTPRPGNNAQSGNTQRRPAEARPTSQRPGQSPAPSPRRSFNKSALVSFFKDTRTHKFLGVLLIVIAALITIFTISHLKNATADQAPVATHTITQIVQLPGIVQNAGGPVGAKTAHLMITRTMGMGSLVVIAYLVFLGLGLLGLRKIKFWSLTFKCLLIAITTSVVLGFVLGAAPTGVYWGGEHGLAVNGWLYDRFGWIGQAAASFLLIAAVVIVYSEELARFIARQKEVYQARRQRLAFEREQEQRRQEALEETRTTIGDEYDESYDDDQPSDDYSEEVDSHYDDEQPYGQGSQQSYQPNSQQTYQPSSQQSYQPNSQQAYQPQEETGSQYQPQFQPQDSDSNADALQQGSSAAVDNAFAANSQNGTEASTSQENGTVGATSGNGPGRFISLQEDVPFAIDEQDIETVPVSIDVVGNNQDQNVPMEISVNDIETVSADEVQPDYDPTAELSRYHKPSLDLLVEHSTGTISVDADEMEANKQMIISTLRHYGIEISSIEATVGPTVTLFEVVPADGVRIASIKRLEDDIARSLSAIGIRIITPMPGKNTVGLEVPNRVPQIVSMRSILSSRAYQETKARLPMAMGTTITNEVFIEDLTKMPHLLVAGATGQGKSVGLNAIITSLIYKKHPSELKFVMVDPKMVEFSLYSKLEKHFLAKLPEEEDPIITDCDKVKQTLNSLCVEMDDRYALLKDAFVRSLEEYNAKFVKHRLNPENGHRYLPYIVVVVDEFADLIMMAGKDIEQPIARIAQKARAVGIHLIIATQRPSTNVITGIIKANFPGRIAFKVSQMVDSRTILDRTGANQLIGKGDMLVMRDSKVERVQCAFVSTEEVEAICDDICNQVGYEHAYYLPEPMETQGGAGGGGDLGGPGFGDRDSMFEECARFLVMQDTASTSMLQRRFSIGYNKAGRIMDQLEAAGIVSAANGQKPRMVLVDPEQLEKMLSNL